MPAPDESGTYTVEVYGAEPEVRWSPVGLPFGYVR